MGTQWGDEGKGKITDFLSKQADVVARYQGGDNAGHTIVFNDTKYKLHLIPSGIFYSDKTCVIGNGMVVNPKSLITELAYLHERGVSTDNLRISNRAHVILPYHQLQDKLEEDAKGDAKVGTTLKGIGPCYMDKAARIGIRITDLLDKEVFAEKLKTVLTIKNRMFVKMYEVDAVEFDDIFEEYYAYGQQFAKYVCDTSVVLNDALDDEQKILFEGAQGVLLDIDHGTYPFVTSSNAASGGVSSGAGIGPSKIDHVVGVCKAYTSRVGDGPFPTQLDDEIGHTIREVGKEYGTTTGRPRRVGWFDSVVVRHSRRVSGITDLCLNSIDVLTGLETLKICTAYEFEGKLLDEYPPNFRVLEQCEPVFEELPGWTEDITGVRKFEDLPVNAQRYVKRIEALTGIELLTFSVGPAREQTVILRDIYEA
ncbi:adenylosuccinate synthetase [Exiguobacterium sp. S17]|nr:adenylosuccinate synthetase [Exiguobacterium sp. S17]